MCATCGCSNMVHASLTDPQTGQTEALQGPDAHHGREHDHHDHAQGHEHHHDHGHDHDEGHLHHHDHTHGHEHHHDHGHDHDHEQLHPHDHAHERATTVALNEEILAKNNRLAERNRGWFSGRNILALNLMSAPGSGKTTLLERTLRDLKDEFTIQVIEGDQATTHDAERIRATGCKVVQINTGSGCHLEADMLARGLQRLAPPPGCMVMVENVGNLVCPALFDLGERAKIVILSVTEGEDKPIKYPHMFRAAQLMILNKIDLLPYLNFDVERCLAYARMVNSGLRIFQLSATKGAGLAEWYGWLRSEMKASSLDSIRLEEEALARK